MSEQIRLKTSLGIWARSGLMVTPFQPTGDKPASAAEPTEKKSTAQ